MHLVSAEEFGQEGRHITWSPQRHKYHTEISKGPSFIPTAKLCQNVPPPEREFERKLVPRVHHLCQMCWVCFMRGRLAESATATEGDAPLICLLWDAWMLLCFKSPPPPSFPSPFFPHHLRSPIIPSILPSVRL